MHIIFFSIVLLLCLTTTHYILKKRRRTYNRIRLKLFAGNITDDEREWAKNNEGAKYTNKQRILRAYSTVRHLPTVVKGKVESRKKKREKARKQAEWRNRKMPSSYSNERSMRDGGKVVLANIADELQNPDGISRVATPDEFLTDSNEPITLNNIPPKKD